MQGEVSYREPEDHSSFAGDVESGSSGTTNAATPGSTAAKKAMLFTSILLFTIVCVTLVRLGDDRPPLRHDSDSPVAPDELKYNQTSEQPKQGQLKTGSIIFSASRDKSSKYENDNFGQDEEIADESEDVQSVTTWTISTESMETTTSTNSSLVRTQGSSDSLLDNMEQQNHRLSVNATDTIHIPYPTSPVPVGYVINYEKIHEMFLKTNLTTISSINSRTVDPITNETLMEDFTQPYSPQSLAHPEAINNSFMVNKFASTIHLPENNFPSSSIVNGFMIDSSTNRKQKRSILTSNFNLSVELNPNPNTSIKHINSGFMGNSEVQPQLNSTEFTFPKQHKNISHVLTLPLESTTISLIDSIATLKDNTQNGEHGEKPQSSTLLPDSIVTLLSADTTMNISETTIQSEDMSISINNLTALSSNNLPIFEKGSSIRPDIKIENLSSTILPISNNLFAIKSTELLTETTPTIQEGITKSISTSTWTDKKITNPTVFPLTTKDNETNLLQTDFNRPTNEDLFENRATVPPFTDLISTHSADVSNLLDSFTESLMGIDLSTLLKQTDATSKPMFETGSPKSPSTSIISGISTISPVNTNIYGTETTKILTETPQNTQEGITESISTPTWTFINPTVFPLTTEDNETNLLQTNFTRPIIEDWFENAVTATLQGSTGVTQSSNSTVFSTNTNDDGLVVHTEGTQTPSILSTKARTVLHSTDSTISIFDVSTYSSDDVSTLLDNFTESMPDIDLSTSLGKTDIPTTRPTFQNVPSISQGTLMNSGISTILPINTNIFGTETTNISNETNPIIQEGITEIISTSTWTDKLFTNSTVFSITTEDSKTNLLQTNFTRPINGNFFENATTTTLQGSTRVTQQSSDSTVLSTNTNDDGLVIHPEGTQTPSILSTEAGTVPPSKDLISTDGAADVSTLFDSFTESLPGIDSSTSLGKTDIQTIRPIFETKSPNSPNTSVISGISNILPVNTNLFSKETSEISTETTTTIQEGITESISTSTWTFTNPTVFPLTTEDNAINLLQTDFTSPINQDLSENTVTTALQGSNSVTQSPDSTVFSTNTNDDGLVTYTEETQTPSIVSTNSGTIPPSTDFISTDGAADSSTSFDSFTESLPGIDSSTSLRMTDIPTTSRPIFETRSPNSASTSVISMISTILPVNTNVFSTETTEILTETTPTIQEGITKSISTSTWTYTNPTVFPLTTEDNGTNLLQTDFTSPINEDWYENTVTTALQEYTGVTQLSDITVFSTNTNDDGLVVHTDGTQTPSILSTEAGTVTPSKDLISTHGADDVSTVFDSFTESLPGIDSSTSLGMTDIQKSRPIFETISPNIPSTMDNGKKSTILPVNTNIYGPETTQISTETTSTTQESITKSISTSTWTDNPFTNPTVYFSTTEDNETNLFKTDSTRPLNEDLPENMAITALQGSASVTQSPDSTVFSTNTNDDGLVTHTEEAQTPSILSTESGTIPPSTDLISTNTAVDSSTLFDSFIESLPGIDSSTSKGMTDIPSPRPIFETISRNIPSTMDNGKKSTIFPVNTNLYGTETTQISSETTPITQDSITESISTSTWTDNPFTNPTVYFSTTEDNETNLFKTDSTKHINEDLPENTATTTLQGSTSVTQSSDSTVFSTNTNDDGLVTHTEEAQTPSILSTESGTIPPSTDLISTNTAVDSSTLFDSFTESLPSIDSSTSLRMTEIPTTSRPISETRSPNSASTSVISRISTMLPVNTNLFSTETTEILTETTSTTQESITKSISTSTWTDNPFTNPTVYFSTTEDNETNLFKTDSTNHINEDLPENTATTALQGSTSVTQSSDSTVFSTNTNDDGLVVHTEGTQTPSIFSTESGTIPPSTDAISTNTVADSSTLFDSFTESLPGIDSSTSVRMTDIPTTSRPIFETRSPNSPSTSIISGISTISPVNTNVFSTETTEISTETTPTTQEGITQSISTSTWTFINPTVFPLTTEDNETNILQTDFTSPINQDLSENTVTTALQGSTGVTQSSDSTVFSTNTNDDGLVVHTEGTQTPSTVSTESGTIPPSTDLISTNTAADSSTLFDSFTESLPGIDSSTSVRMTDIPTTSRPIFETRSPNSPSTSIISGISTISPVNTNVFSTETTEISTETTPITQEGITESISTSTWTFINPTVFPLTTEDNETNILQTDFTRPIIEDGFENTVTTALQGSTHSSDSTVFSTNTNDDGLVVHTDGTQTPSILSTEAGTVTPSKDLISTHGADDVSTLFDSFIESLPGIDSSTSLGMTDIPTSRPIFETISPNIPSTMDNGKKSTILPVNTNVFSTETTEILTETTSTTQESITESISTSTWTDNPFTNPTVYFSTTEDNEINLFKTDSTRPINEDLSENTVRTALQGSTSVMQSSDSTIFSPNTNNDGLVTYTKETQTPSIFSTESGTIPPSTDAISTNTVADSSTLFDSFTESLPGIDSSTSVRMTDIPTTSRPIFETRSPNIASTSVISWISTILPVNTNIYGTGTTQISTETTPTIQEGITDIISNSTWTDKPFTNPTVFSLTTDDNETNLLQTYFTRPTNEDLFENTITPVLQGSTSVTRSPDSTFLSTNTNDDGLVTRTEGTQTSSILSTESGTLPPSTDPTTSIFDVSTHSSGGVSTLFDSSTESLSDIDLSTSLGKTDIPTSRPKFQNVPSINRGTLINGGISTMLSMNTNLYTPETTELSTLTTQVIQEGSTESRDIPTVLDSLDDVIPKTTYVPELLPMSTIIIPFTDRSTITSRKNDVVSTTMENPTLSLNEIQTTEGTDDISTLSTALYLGAVETTREEFSDSRTMSTLAENSTGTSGVISTSIGEDEISGFWSTLLPEISTSSVSATITVSPQSSETTITERSLAPNESTSSPQSSETFSSQSTTPMLLHQANNTERLKPLSPQFKVSTTSKSINFNIHRTTLVSLLPTQTPGNTLKKKTTILQGRSYGSSTSKKLSKLPTRTPTEATSKMKEETKKRKTTTPIYPQLPSTEYFSPSTSTIRYYYGYTFPLPWRPSSRLPKPQQPKNYYMYYLRRGHFPLCAAILAFFHHITECFK